MENNFEPKVNMPEGNNEPPKFKVLTEIQAGSVTETDTIDEIEKIEAIDRELEKQKSEEQAQAQTQQQPQAQQPPKPAYTFSGYSDYSASSPATNISYAPPPPQQPPVFRPQPQPQPKPRRKKQFPGAALIGIFAGITLVIGLIGGIVGGMLIKGNNKVVTSGGGTTVIYKSVTLKDKDGNKIKEQLSVGEVAEIAAPSVVEITTEAVTTSGFMGQYVTEGAGSGVIISEDGYIVTNHHVIDGATKVSIRTNDGTSYTAQLIGSDAKTDLAVLKVEATGLSPAIIGEYEDCKVGDTVVAIGNPLGELGGTVTDGIISALDRDVTIDGQIMTLMQTNTAISPGNSGGGLFNTSGQLIGVVNAKSSGEGIEGLGFAIPVDLAEEVIEDLIEYGYVTGRIEYGFEIVEINDWQTQMLYRVEHQGVYIYSVFDNSNAQKAGLRPGDLIKSINGKTIKTGDDSEKAIEGLEIGDTIKLTVIRNSREITVEFELTEYKPNSNSTLF